MPMAGITQTRGSAEYNTAVIAQNPALSGLTRGSAEYNAFFIDNLYLANNPALSGLTGEPTPTMPT